MLLIGQLALPLAVGGRVAALGKEKGIAAAHGAVDAAPSRLIAALHAVQHLDPDMLKPFLIVVFARARLFPAQGMSKW